MASPMRKKRAWSTREDDAESKETAAFEATVAAAKDTAAKSGAFLSTAKSDLTDHRRWLQAQTVAVERDRARHERWLERQRDHRLAIARRERVRRQRQLMRQRAFRAMQQAAWAAVLFVRSLVVLAIAKTVAGIKYVAALIARGVVLTGAKLWDVVRYVAHLVAASARWTAARLLAFALAIGRMFSAGLVWSGAKAGLSARAGGAALAAGSSLVASKAGGLSRSAGRSLGTGFSAASAKGSALADVTGRSAASGFSTVSNKAAVLGAASKRGLAVGYAWSKARVLALAPALYVRIAKFGRQAERYARTGAARVEGEFEKAKGSPQTRSEAPDAADDPWTAPARLAAQGTEVYGPFYEGFWVEGVSPNDPQGPDTHPPAREIVAPRAGTENTLFIGARSVWAQTKSWTQGAWARGSRVVSAFARSTFSQSSWAQGLWARTRDADLSQMMIIAGAVLLVCGGLLLGGGLILRAGAGAGAGTTPQASEEASNGIAWTFAELDRPLPERAVFTLSGTPASFRINGLSLSGTNHSDQALTAVHGILKPDVQRPDLKLTLQLDKPAVQAGEGDTEAQALEIVPENMVPPRAAFRLVFPFPPEAMDGADGITVEEFFDSYGGLLLKLRYEIDGKQKSLIQYLPPDLIKSQLDEVAVEAGGS